MVSEMQTELERGVVEWKPDPKNMPDAGNGPWTSYQIKVNGKYFDCNKATFDTLRVKDDIEFTFSSKPYTKRDGSEGFRRKIANLIGGSTSSVANNIAKIRSMHEEEAEMMEKHGIEIEVPLPRPNPQVGKIGSLPGAEIGAMENRAWQEAMRVAALAGEQGIRDEDYQALLLQQARMGGWFKAQPIPPLETGGTPLQDDPGYVLPDAVTPVEEPESMRDGPPDDSNAVPEKLPW